MPLDYLRRIVVTAVGILLSCAASRADTFTFTFSEDPLYGNVGGTVSGEIFGLVNNSTTAATEVLIQDYPSAFDFTGMPPINATDLENQIENSFTVVDDQIVAGSFYAYNQPNPSQFGISLSLNYPGTNTNNLTAIDFSGVNGSAVLADIAGLEGLNISYVPDVPDVPEPDMFAAIAVLIVGAIGFRRRMPHSRATSCVRLDERRPLLRKQRTSHHEWYQPSHKSLQ